MKTLIAMTFSITLGLAASSAHAQSVFVTPNVYWGPTFAQASVCNYYGAPIVCSGQLTAQTNFGPSIFSTMNYARLLPGMCGQLYANSYYGAPITYAWATVYCNFSY